MTDKPLTVASRSVTLRDFAIFQIKLFLDGIKDFVAIWLSVGAIILDFIAGRGKRPRLFYSVVRASERFDRWINLHGVVKQMDDLETDDGLFGASRAGDDSLVGKIEQLVRGGDEPRRAPSVDPEPPLTTDPLSSLDAAVADRERKG
jgi:hypothetical protein